MKFSRILLRRISLIVIGLGIVAGPGRAIAQRPGGIDVSAYQGSQDTPPTNINWPTVASDGAAFAWAKATEGITIVDPDFTYNAVNAKAAGVPIGAYHFARPELNTGTAGADSEAAFFWRTAGSYITTNGMSMMPMLDYEVSPGGTLAGSEAWINEWCNDIVNYGQAHYVVAVPIIYTDINISSDWIGATNTQWASWFDDMYGGNPETGAPRNTYPWPTWTFWQFDIVDIPGITGGVDVDVFNGTSTELTNYVASSYGIDIVSQPASITVLQGSNATFSITATGAGTLGYQWMFNGSNIAGATAPQYNINNVQFTNAGGYAVLLTNSLAGNIVSATVYLSVLGPLTNAPGAIVGPAGLLNWWPADWNTLDIIGGNNGTPAGLLTYVPGEENMAFNFDGATTVISNGTASLLSSSWTACMWVNYQYSPQPSSVLLANNADSLKLEQTGGLHEVGVSVAGVGDYVFSPAYSVPTNTWTHLAFVENSSGITLYVNGALQGSLANKFSLPRGYIGATYSSSATNYVDFMLGSLDNIMTFNAALSAAQINAIYSAGSSGLIEAPAITSATLTGSNQVTINLEGQTGKFYSIYSSTNLTNWTLVETLLNTQGTNLFIDNAATSGQKYYRVSQTY